MATSLAAGGASGGGPVRAGKLLGPLWPTVDLPLLRGLGCPRFATGSVKKPARGPWLTKVADQGYGRRHERLQWLAMPKRRLPERATVAERLSFVVNLKVAQFVRRGHAAPWARHIAPAWRVAFRMALGGLVLGGAVLGGRPRQACGEEGSPDLELAGRAVALLRERCQACHGAELREGGLRLDSRAAALAGGDGGAAVVPGQVEASPLWQRVTADDPAQRMPQDEAPLSEAERDVLRGWIASGAAWPFDSVEPAAARHWAFEPLAAVEVPEPAFPDLARNPIDAFVQARLAAESLRPAPEADRATLLSRLSLDLIGLPPSPDELAAFQVDTSAEAYERQVDRLLASPHYGERWARRWLDLARYADTNGYEKDRPRSIWPYRDWVIQALNDDLPFDRFTVAQLAGDLLPGATPSERIATGFHRNTMVNEEGGIDVEEFRHAAIVDRVATSATVWLGLTLGCAQCHSHKYDPLSQREYYAMFAFFNNVDEPECEVPDPQIAAQREPILRQIAEAEASLSERLPLPAELAGAGDEEVARRNYWQQRQAAWEAEMAARAVPWQIVAPTQVRSLGGATLTVEPDGSVLATGDKPNFDTYVVELETPLEQITALRLEALPHASLPLGGPGRAPLFEDGNFFLSELTVEAWPPGDASEAAARGEGRDGEDSGEPLPIAEATQSYAASGREAALAIDGRLDTGWTVAGQIGRAHQAVFRFGQSVRHAGGTRLRITLTQQYIHQLTLGRFRLSLSGAEGEIRASGLTAEPEAALLVPADARTEQQRSELRRAFLAQVPELAEARKQIDELRAGLPRFATTLVVEERRPEHARRTQVFHRGDFLQPRQTVEPGVPAVLPPLAADAPRDRLALARWLVDPGHPLVSRVTVNRQWEAFFGRGLVSTLDDFGTRGARPTHPELLDWLARRFIADGWSLKRLHRLIVTSHTYRQASAARPELAQRDPANELLARGPRFRLDAELIRDRALAVSGLLNRRIGGPSVFPPQPPGVSELAYGDVPWPTDTGPNRYRRGLYTYAKRTSPYATAMLFDGPTGETCLARRERSNTPLQALTLLNDTVFVEAAQALGRWAADQTDPAELEGEAVDSSPAPRASLVAATDLRRLFSQILSRPAEADELAALEVFCHEQVRRLLAGELSAGELLGASPEQAASKAGESDTAGAEHQDTAGSGDRLRSVRQAALILSARALLNLDEFICRE